MCSLAHCWDSFHTVGNCWCMRSIHLHCFSAYFSVSAWEMWLVMSPLHPVVLQESFLKYLLLCLCARYICSRAGVGGVHCWSISQVQRLASALAACLPPCWGSLCWLLGCALGPQKQQQVHGKHALLSLNFLVVLLESLWNCFEDWRISAPRNSQCWSSACLWARSFMDLSVTLSMRSSTYDGYKERKLLEAKASLFSQECQSSILISS